MKALIAIGVIVLLLVVGFSNYVGARNQMVIKHGETGHRLSQSQAHRRSGDGAPGLAADDAGGRDQLGGECGGVRVNAE